jgi:hypothetical protein
MSESMNVKLGIVNLIKQRNLPMIEKVAQPLTRF